MGSTQISSRTSRSTKRERYLLYAVNLPLRQVLTPLPLGKALIASFATFFLAEGSAQISFALLLRSFEVHKGYRLIMTILSGLVAIWMLAGLIQMAASASTQIASPTVRLSKRNLRTIRLTARRKHRGLGMGWSPSSCNAFSSPAPCG